MIIGKIEKSPGDTKRYTLDYADWLSEDERVTTADVTSGGNLNPEAGIVIEASEVSDDGKKVVFFVNGGLDDTGYDIAVSVTTDKSQVKTDRIICFVTGG